MKDRANAKINLALNVCGTLDNGYHELESIFLPLELADEVSVEETNENHDYLTANIDSIPLDEKNLALKALKLMKETYHLEKNYHVHLEKKIPSEAGLGGGSSDAAAVMRIINKMEGLNISIKELADLSVKLGADCPFCVYNTPAFVGGIGEKVEPFDLKKFPFHVLLVKPASGVSTKLAYEELNMGECDHPRCLEIKKKLEEGHFYNLELGNSLEESALRINRDVKSIKYMLMGFGFDYVLMSGSGACVFALTKSLTLLTESYEFLENKYKFVEKTEIIHA